MRSADDDPSSRDALTATWIELAIKISVLGLLLYLCFTLVRPFISTAIWAVILTVALCPLYDWLVDHLGGRRRLAALLLTIASLLIVIGPGVWLALGLIDSLRTLSERIDLSILTPPPPPTRIKSWPIIGDSIYQFWDQASTNFQTALTRLLPYLKPLGGIILEIAAGAGISIVKFVAAIIVAGFLFSPAPALADNVRRLSRRLAPGHGDEFVRLAAASIRAVSRGVIGISALQAILAGVGLMVAGVPAVSLITSAVLILGIIQIGPAIVLIPLVIWSWTAMDTATALLFSVYMIAVGLLDNLLKPLVMGRGLDTPVLIILIGVLGGTISYGISGLFLGPIVLAVIWQLAVAWIDERDSDRHPAA